MWTTFKYLSHQVLREWTVTHYIPHRQTLFIFIKRRKKRTLLSSLYLYLFFPSVSRIVHVFGRYIYIVLLLWYLRIWISGSFLRKVYRKKAQHLKFFSIVGKFTSKLAFDCFFEHRLEREKKTKKKGINKQTTNWAIDGSVQCHNGRLDGHKRPAPIKRASIFGIYSMSL